MAKFGLAWLGWQPSCRRCAAAHLLFSEAVKLPSVARPQVQRRVGAYNADTARVEKPQQLAHGVDRVVHDCEPRFLA